jgi:hypothetical protein
VGEEKDIFDIFWRPRCQDFVLVAFLGFLHFLKLQLHSIKTPGKRKQTVARKFVGDRAPSRIWGCPNYFFFLLKKSVSLRHLSVRSLANIIKLLRL